MERDASCDRCGRSLDAAPEYRIESERRCLRCALRDRPMLARSLNVAVWVGTILTLLNQGDQLFGTAPLPASLAWKIPLTYLVPFFVATYGAISNAKR